MRVCDVRRNIATHTKVQIDCGNIELHHLESEELEHCWSGELEHSWSIEHRWRRELEHCWSTVC